MSLTVKSISVLLAKKAADYAKNWAQKSARPRGHFEGKYTDHPVDDVAAAVSYTHLERDDFGSLYFRHSCHSIQF